MPPSGPLGHCNSALPNSYLWRGLSQFGPNPSIFWDEGNSGAGVMCIKPPWTCSARSLCAVLRQSSFAQCEQFQSTALLWGVISTDGMRSAMSWSLCQGLNCIICWFCWRQTQHSDLKAQFIPVLPPMSLMCSFSFSKQRQLCCSLFCHSTLVGAFDFLGPGKRNVLTEHPKTFLHLRNLACLYGHCCAGCLLCPSYAGELQCS